MMMLLLTLPWFKNKQQQKPPNRFIYWQIKWNIRVLGLYTLSNLVPLIIKLRIPQCFCCPAADRGISLVPLSHKRIYKDDSMDNSNRLQ